MTEGINVEVAPFAGITDEQWVALTDACYKYHRARTGGAGAEGPCACGMSHGTSKACEALRRLQDIRVVSAQVHGQENAP